MKSEKKERSHELTAPKSDSAIVEGSFSFGRNSPYQSGAMETDTKVAASYEENIAWIWFRLPLFLFVLGSVRRIVNRAWN